MALFNQIPVIFTSGKSIQSNALTYFVFWGNLNVAVSPSYSYSTRP